jgi:cytochrome c-type biogenesis protein CcmH
VTLFVVLCGLLLALAVGLVAWPLLRKPRADETGERAGIAAAVVAAILPVAAFAIYFAASNWDWHAPPVQAGPGMPDIPRAIVALQAKLAEEPGNVENWKLLGRSATVTGDFPLARKAFGEAYTRTQGRDPDAVVGYAEARVLIDEREIDGEAGELFEKALELAPANPRALWYGGIVAYRRGDLKLAQQRWVELQDFDLPTDLRQVLAERLAELERTQGAPGVGSGASPQARVEIAVAITPALASKVPAGATLFVIARRGTGGPPLAVRRQPVGSWPVTLGLSDADAMLPGTKLAEGGPVTLIARISRSGQPIAASGDLFGEVGYDFASAHPATLTIDRIVP